jgi:capsular polysaccharide biosynthesis protein
MIQSLGGDFVVVTIANLIALAPQIPAVQAALPYIATVAAAGRYTRRAPVLTDITALNHMIPLHEYYVARLTEEFAPVHHVALRNVTVFGEGSIIAAGKLLILESCSEFFTQHILPPGLSTAGPDQYRLSHEPSRHISKPALLAKRPFWRNYGHWMVDGAMLLALLPELILPEGCPIIVGAQTDSRMRAIVKESVALLAPGATLLEHPDGETWTFSELHYVSPVHVSPLTKLPKALTALRNRVLAGQPRPVRRRRVYVMRDPTRSRRLENEPQVIQLCLHHGFEVVQPEHHSLREQTALFQAADFIVGVKGAALTNAIFCSEGANLLVLSPSDWVDPFFWDIAGQLGLAYGEIYGPVATATGPQGTNPFSIDIDRLARHLAVMMRT